MFWVDKISEATGWNPRGLHVPWSEIERDLRSPLPGDFKELSEAFGRGTFNGYLEILSNSDGNSLGLLENTQAIWQILTRYPVQGEYDPYGFFDPGRGGLLQWGTAETEDQFYWLTKPGNPDSWKVVARQPSGPWRHSDMSMSEFVFRLISDPEFEGFDAGNFESPPIFESY